MVTIFSQFMYGCIFLVCGTAQSAQDGDIKQEIEKANTEFSAAYKKGDAKAVSEMYTESGQLFPPSSDIVEGRQGIEKFWKSAMEMGIARVELDTIEVEAFGETVVESGRATLYGKGGEVIDKGKYLVMWKNVDGKWKLHRDCWNSSQAHPQN